MIETVFEHLPAEYTRLAGSARCIPGSWRVVLPRGGGPLGGTYWEQSRRPLPVSPEVEVLLCAASVTPLEERIDRLRALLAQDLDWEYLLAAAEHHCIPSLLYWHLSRAGLDRVSETAAAALKRSYTDIVQRNMLFVQELLHLVALLREASIPVVPYKGPLLAHALYDDLAQRQMWDLDLLVKEADLARAKRLLLDDGYQIHYDPRGRSASGNRTTRGLSQSAERA